MRIGTYFANISNFSSKFAGFRMKNLKFHIAALLAAILCFSPLYGQKDKKAGRPEKGYIMPYVINGKDTVFVDDITPAVVSPRKKGMSKRQWRAYYKRVHNFSKAYPYATFIAGVIKQTDSIFLADNYTKSQQDRYLENLKKDLLKECEPVFRNLTLAQGLMTIRLIDREVGMTPYYILKQYLSSPTAVFWQAFARLFSGNLKQPYDRFGEDRDLEELVNIWEQGKFDRLYFSIFGRSRPTIYIPERFR